MIFINYIQIKLLLYIQSQKINKQRFTMQAKMTTLNPLHMMKSFYNDYNKARVFSTPDDTVCKYARKKSSDTDKMTKFLKHHQQKTKRASTIQSSQYRNTPKMHHEPCSTNRHTLNVSYIEKRSYFKNIYSQSNPFLVSQQKIFSKDINQIKGMKTQPIQPLAKAMLYQNFKLMNPSENRKTIQQMRQTINRFKLTKKQKMEKIRYNFIFNNSFKHHLENSQHKNQVSSRIRKLENNTKQRIFPVNL